VTVQRTVTALFVIRRVPASRHDPHSALLTATDLASRKDTIGQFDGG
jgi:hypothetical protein